ncbi:hypothetical protein D7193_14570 [Micromonospora costi]|uniref:Uncharacterized protein n=1 Tax=Micromonospora costi TaxID=1530042 RepID=A0A3B0A5G2_9ACTN|nr:hypothetical protein D7193_14570 [Micromonospora costi]
MIGPPWPFGAKGGLRNGLPPGPPVDRRALLRSWLLVLAALVLVIMAGIFGSQLGRLAAPTLVRWQIDYIDSRNEPPPLPALPQSPFAR